MLTGRRLMKEQIRKMSASNLCGKQEDHSLLLYWSVKFMHIIGWIIRHKFLSLNQSPDRIRAFDIIQKAWQVA